MWTKMDVAFMELLNLFYHNNDLMNWVDFWHADANSGRLKITLVISGWFWSKMGMILNELINWTDFLHTGTNSGKLKITSIITGWMWSKISVAFMVLSKQLYLKNDFMNWAVFIHADTNPGKLEITLIIIEETSNMSMPF